MQKIIISICAALIILLFMYTATSKLVDMRQFRHDMLNQPFPHWLGYTLSFALPLLEIGTSVCLLFERSRLLGLWISWTLMLLFTLYAALILGNVFGRIPCSCGGFIRKLSWPQHLSFNIFFLLIATVGVYLQARITIQKTFHAHETGQTENL